MKIELYITMYKYGETYTTGIVHTSKEDALKYFNKNNQILLKGLFEVPDIKIEDVAILQEVK